MNKITDTKSQYKVKPILGEFASVDIEEIKSLNTKALILSFIDAETQKLVDIAVLPDDAKQIILSFLKRFSESGDHVAKMILQQIEEGQDEQNEGEQGEY